MRIPHIVLFFISALLMGAKPAPSPQSQATSTPTLATAPTIKVGVLTPLTGDSAAYGKYTRQGLELAQTELKNAGFELVFKDTRADALEAVRLFKELKAEGAQLVIGPFTSTEVRTVGPEAQRLGIPLITSSATADDLSSLGEHIFMMLPPNSKQGADQARYALEKLGAKKAAILYRENPYGQTLRSSFAKTFRDGGGTIVIEKGFPDGEQAFGDRLMDIKSKAPEVVFVPAHDDDTGRILRQAREKKFPATVRFLGADGSMSGTMLDLARESAEGSVFSNVASVSPSFDAAFKAKYGEDPSPYAASAYDTFRIVAKLVASGARASQELQRGLTTLEAFEGATGVTRFSQREKAYWAFDKPYRQYEVKSGEFRLIR